MTLKLLIGSRCPPTNNSTEKKYRDMEGWLWSSVLEDFQDMKTFREWSG